MDKENIMRERDTLVESRNDIVEMNLKLKKQVHMLQSEISQSKEEQAVRIFKLFLNVFFGQFVFLILYKVMYLLKFFNLNKVFVQKHEKMVSSHEQEMISLHCTIQSQSISLQQLEQKKYLHDDINNEIQESRFKIKALVCENNKLQADLNVLRFKINP